jgi:hypothetical protein
MSLPHGHLKPESIRKLVMMQTHDRNKMAEEEMKNDGAASAKPDRAHTRQDLDWAWHMITKQHSLQTQANALAQQNREESMPV